VKVSYSHLLKQFKKKTKLKIIWQNQDIYILDVDVLHESDSVRLREIKFSID